MTWARLDDKMPENPKILGLTLGSKWALVELWCYCAGHETDGYVPTIAATRRATKKQLDELSAAALIHVDLDGWTVNDWLDYNISAADAKKKRDGDAKRLREYRERKAKEAVDASL